MLRDKYPQLQWVMWTPVPEDYSVAHKNLYVEIQEALEKEYMDVSGLNFEELRWVLDTLLEDGTLKAGILPDPGVLEERMEEFYNERE